MHHILNIYDEVLTAILVVLRVIIFVGHKYLDYKYGPDELDR